MSLIRRLVRPAKGSGYLGRIGVHEILNTTLLADKNIKYLDMYEAGMRHVKSGLINEASLLSEIGTWH